MRNRALIIGGSVAGLQAALDLADSGVAVHLVEGSPFLADSTDTIEIPPHLLNTRALEVLRHPNITVWNQADVCQLKTDGDGFQVKILQKPRGVDLSRCTACGECIEVCPVTVVEMDGKTPRKAIYFAGQPECAAIDKLGKAPCASTCPGGIHVQGYVALIAQKRYEEAIQLIRQAIPFPSVCGRVCNHYCEANCTRGKVDAPVNIMALKRFVADWAYQHRDVLPKHPIEITEASDYKVAIIGAGPSGLTAARDLIRLGHAVTVFDALPTAGGMMRVGIPPHRLPSALLDWEIQQIIDEGVELKLNTWVDDIPGLLEHDYHAVLIATGANKAKKLPLRNANHPDNWLSLDLLRRVCLGEKIDLSGKKVVVLGGGNVALDTVRTVIRLGANEVRMVCLEPRGEMPGFEWEVAVAEGEGAEICPGRTFKEILIKDNNIVGVRCAEVNFHGMVKGRLSFDEIPNTEHTLPTDLVIWAIGQEPDFSYLPQDISIEAQFPTGIRSDENMMTTMKGVFVAGDVHRGMTFFVIDAIGEGHKAARSIDRYLRGQAGLQEPAAFTRVEFTPEESAARYQTSQASRQMRVQISSIPIEERIRNFHEVDLTISEDQALTEARRCLQCGVCSECLSCVEVCKAGAIDHNQSDTQSWLNVAAIIAADNATSFNDLASGTTNVISSGTINGAAFFHAKATDPSQGSAAAARVLCNLPFQPQAFSIPTAPNRKTTSGRIGVFICQCGDRIANIIDTDSIASQASQWPDVVHAESISFACAPEFVETIQTRMKAHALDRVVLAACSCCDIDQVCFSCTYQRVRCRANLGIFAPIDNSGNFTGKLSNFTRFEFVNIREQAAWVHQHDPPAATDKARTLIEAAIGKVRAVSAELVESRPIESSALILGKGPAATTCQTMLRQQGIQVHPINTKPQHIRRSLGQFVVQAGSQVWQASTLIMIPENQAESREIMAAFGRERHQPKIRPSWGGLETHRPGVFYINPEQASEIAGAAVTARVNAWISRSGIRPPTAAVVDPARCRACETCIDICEVCAPELVEIEGRYTSWIDPVICSGCGTCAAHCPSGAITMGCQNETQIEAMLSAILSGE